MPRPYAPTAAALLLAACSSAPPPPPSPPPAAPCAPCPAPAAALGPLRFRVYVGGADSFHLEEGVISLCDLLKEKGSDATCEIFPGKGHFDLYGKDLAAPDGLLARIARGMVDRAATRRPRGH